MLGPTQAANAADHDVQFSTDGITYGSTIAGPLFGAGAIVPGGVRHATLYVKNATSHDALLDLHIMDATASAAVFVESLILQGAVANVTGAPVDLGTAGNCTILVSGPSISAGRSVKVALTLAMMSSVTDAVAQRESAAVDLRISLTEAGVPATDDRGCVDGIDVPVFAAGPAEPANLASTGVDPQLPLIFGGLLLGIGIALLLARRRREHEE